MVMRRSDNGVWVSGADPIAAIGAANGSEGERRLMIAVLAHALRSLFSDAVRPGRGAARRLRQDLRWLVSDDRTDPFSFERICEALDVDADRIRSHVLSDLGDQTAVLMAEPARPRRSRAPFVAPTVYPAETPVAVAVG